MRLSFDAFASPAQIGELHHIAMKEDLAGSDTCDNLVRHLTGKYPRDLMREDADRLIAEWTRYFPLLAMSVVMAEMDRSRE